MGRNLYRVNEPEEEVLREVGRVTGVGREMRVGKGKFIVRFY